MTRERDSLASSLARRLPINLPSGNERRKCIYMASRRPSVGHTFFCANKNIYNNVTMTVSADIIQRLQRRSITETFYFVKYASDKLEDYLSHTRAFPVDCSIFFFFFLTVILSVLPSK